MSLTIWPGLPVYLDLELLNSFLYIPIGLMIMSFVNI